MMENIPCPNCKVVFPFYREDKVTPVTAIVAGSSNDKVIELKEESIYWIVRFEYASEFQTFFAKFDYPIMFMLQGDGNLKAVIKLSKNKIEDHLNKIFKFKKDNDMDVSEFPSELNINGEELTFDVD